jgi:acyl-coenzyme A thioesterase PaaI-like protein
MTESADSMPDNEAANHQAQPASATADMLRQAGWQPHQEDGFMGLVGPLWERRDASGIAFALLSEPRHANRRDTVHGGMLMAFADRALGGTARAADPLQRHVTVQLDMHFIDAPRVGELIEGRCRVVRRTSSLIFLEGEFTAGGRIVATAKGIWKLLRPAKVAPAQGGS